MLGIVSLVLLMPKMMKALAGMFVFLGGGVNPQTRCSFLADEIYRIKDALFSRKRDSKVHCRIFLRG